MDNALDDNSYERDEPHNANLVELPGKGCGKKDETKT